MQRNGQEKSLKAFARYSWFTLGYTVMVILWGAFVRATGSGAGCGAHWPACNGVVIPRSPSVETMIEYSHRLTSGVALILVAILFIWAIRAFPKGHALRRASGYSLLFIIIEALIGAGIVLFGLVAENDSAARAVVIALHLINTFILLGFMTYCCWYAQQGYSKPARFRAGLKISVLCAVGVMAFLWVSASGAIVALGDTLFPAQSLAHGWQEKFSPGAHFLIKLRWLHPIIAVACSFFLIYLVQSFRWRGPADLQLYRAGQCLVALIVLQLGIGIINVILLAPVWMQLVHLFVADAMWVALVIFCLQAIALPHLAETRQGMEGELARAGSSSPRQAGEKVPADALV